MTLDPIGQSNIEAIDQAEKIQLKSPITGPRQPTNPQRTGANKGIKLPKLPKVIVNHGKRKPGGRTGTSPSQRSASRRNINKALLSRQARRVR